MTRPFILSLLAAGLLLAACKKNNTSQAQNTLLSEASDTLLAPLAGQWQWIQQTKATAVFGTPDEITTAKGLGITEYLDIDSSNWTWTLIRNGSTINSGTCKIIRLLTPGPSGSDGTLSLDFVDHGKDSTVNHWLSADNDTLYTTNMEINPTYNVDMYVRMVTTNY